MRLVIETITLISISILLLIFNFETALSLILFFGFLSFIIFIMFYKRLDQIGVIRQKNSSLLIKQINQALGSIREIILYRIYSLFINKFKFHNSKYASAEKRDIIIDLPRHTLEFSSVLIFVIVTFLLLNRGETISEILIIIGVFVFASTRILPCITKIIKSIQSIRFNYPALKVIIENIKINNSSENTLVNNQLNDDDTPFSKLEFLNVYFDYSNLNKEINKSVLSDITFKINKFENIGVIGKTGSGKTTLINLIAGLIEPSNGKILFNSVNLNENISNWQKKIGYVSQNVYLADENIYFNVALKEEHLIDKNKVKNLLKFVDLYEYFSELPEKFDTTIGERGSMLSGGQCQRLGIARALYRDPDIIILDEATSALDEKTEDLILKNLYLNIKDKTIITVSHRTNSLKYCEKIFEIKEEI